MSLKYRRLDENGDYIFGHSNYDFLEDIEAVAQAIYTKIKLLQGEWWEDVQSGTPLFQSMLGGKVTNNTKDALDLIIRDRILEVDGVNYLQDFESSIDSVKRTYTFKTTVNTIYGELQELTINL